MLTDDLVLRNAFVAEAGRNHVRAVFYGAGAVALVCCGIATIVWAAKNKPEPVVIEKQAPVVLPDVSKQPSDPAIQRSVTVFSTVAIGDTSVVSGWTYPNGAGKVPTFQYCYMIKSNPDGTNTRLSLQSSTGGVVKTETTAFSQEDQDRAREQCVWFKGEA